MNRGPHKIVSSRDVYKNPWIIVHEDKIIRQNGKDGTYGVVEYSPGVSTVALTDKNEIFLVQEYHYAVDEYGISLPGGGIDKNETPLEAAKRELAEESGVTADKWVELGSVHSLPMIINNTDYLFLALGAKVSSEHEEEFKLIIVSFDEAVRMVFDSKIKHSASCEAILRAREYLSR